MGRLVEVKVERGAGAETTPAAAEQRSRRAERAGPQAVPATVEPRNLLKEYGERVAKYVPAEVLAFYIGAVQLIQTHQSSTFRIWAFGAFALAALIATPVWLGMFAENPRSKLPNQLIGGIAFLIWAYAYPAGIVFALGWHDPVAAGLLLLLFTFGIGFYQPKAKG